MTAGGGQRRGRRALAALFAFAAIAFAALGAWQVQRLFWKLGLIERVEARVDAPPVPAPPRAAWPTLDAKAQEYRRVAVRGAFLHDRETLVEALTERGPGFWVVTPLSTAEGVVLVNRGFVPPERRAPAARAAGQVAGAVAVTGLLRAPEPDGRFLRPNAPRADRWYSRDVAAIARARGLEAAPFFIDADRTVPGGPVGGMTVVRFRNTHLVYALTWFGLMAMAIAGLVFLRREAR